MSLRPLLEGSGTGAIPQVNQMRSGLAVFVFGPPMSGKTTFVRSYLGSPTNTTVSADKDVLPGSSIRTPYGVDYKLFNSDTVSTLSTRDPSVRRAGSTEITKKLVLNYISTGKNFVHDSTGNNVSGVQELVEACRNNGYKVLFIHVISDEDFAYARGANRPRAVSDDYFKDLYQRTGGISDSLSALGPDWYYVVESAEDGYRYMMKGEEGFYARNHVGEYVLVPGLEPFRKRKII